MADNSVPLIFEKTKDGSGFLFDVFSRLSKDRIIFLYDEIDSEVATSIAATLLLLDSQSQDKPIQLFINSPGGTVDDGLFTIYDMINYIKAPVHTVCIGTAYSAAALILAAGVKGERRILPNATVMIHEVRSGVGGNSTDIQRDAKQIGLLNENLMKKIAEHTGQNINKIKELCKHDEYFNAKEAKEFGLVDIVVGDSLNLKASKKRSSKK